MASENVQVLSIGTVRGDLDYKRIWIANVRVDTVFQERNDYYYYPIVSGTMTFHNSFIASKVNGVFKTPVSFVSDRDDPYQYDFIESYYSYDGHPAVSPSVFGVGFAHYIKNNYDYIRVLTNKSRGIETLASIDCDIHCVAYTDNNGNMALGIGSPVFSTSQYIRHTTDQDFGEITTTADTSFLPLFNYSVNTGDRRSSVLRRIFRGEKPFDRSCFIMGVMTGQSLKERQASKATTGTAGAPKDRFLYDETSFLSGIAVGMNLEGYRAK